MKDLLEEFARDAVELVLVGGVAVRVISIDDLIENKRTVGRKQDKLDVEFLERVRAKRQ
ncbi:MAG: hypothetical protein ABIP39_11870 [Polyangiaceae bacterium]